MRTLNIIGAVALSLVMFTACEQEEADFQSPQVEKVKQDISSKAKARCSANCPGGKCKARGSNVSCQCFLGTYPQCTATAVVAFQPTQSSDEINFIGDYVDFIGQNISPPSVANGLVGVINQIQTTIQNQDSVSYSNLLPDYEFHMINLSDDNKNIINDFFVDNDFEPVFE